MNNLLHGEFPKNALEQAAAATRIRTSAYVARRLDLRGKTVFAFAQSEDSPAGTAFSLSKGFDGWQLGVHVADVCEYVCADSPLDIEARRRCAAFGAAGERSEMLPDSLVYDLCDLTGDSDKLTLSILLDIASDGSLRSINFEESVVRGAGKCLYCELEHLGNAGDTSAIMLLRGKYAPYVDTLLDMYELAAVLHSARVARGAADFEYFRKVYLRNEEGKIDSIIRETEPDARAMVREIGFFASEAVGKYMTEKKLPSIFIGQETLPEHILDYLSALLKHKCDEKDPAKRTAHIAELAKGSEYYSFICEMLNTALPCAKFSDKPIPNSLCCSDRIVSFFRPTSRYTDLLTLRTIKESIIAAGNVKNLNLNRHLKIVSEAAQQATAAEEYVYNVHTRYRRQNALNYIENSASGVFKGFPISRLECGSIMIYLECGVRALITSADASSFDFEPAKPTDFTIVALGTPDEETIVAPC